MPRGTRVVGHATLLAALVVFALNGVVTLASYLMMLTAALLGHFPMPEPSVVQVALGVLMVGLGSAVIMTGLGALLRQCRGCIELSRWVDETGSTPSPRLGAAARGSTLPDRLVEVADDRPYAFTYGIWRPRIVVSSGLVAATTDDELVAVLHHEDDHRHHRDPLKVLALRTWTAALFLVPLLGAVLHRVLEGQELRADRAAVRACGVSSVAGALLKAVGEPTTAAGTALAAMGGPALLDARVTQLETGSRPRLRTVVRPARVVSSLPGAALIAGYGVAMYQLCLAVQLCRMP